MWFKVGVLFVLFYLVIGNISGYSQNNLVKGKVLDAEMNSPLPGANVFLKGNSTIGATTDLDGNFLIKIPAGDQILVFSYLGFKDLEKEIKGGKDENITLVIKMESDAVMGQEVVITGQLLGQAKAINQQLSAESIANIVSSDRIQELPDVNAAEAIARLPGVAINRSGGEGTKIVIRGLEPKFNAITVNGVRMPANSANDRSVDLSLISPEMLDGIEVFKSPLPDMDGEAIGGTVNLKLRKAPSGLKMLGKLLGGYNDLNNDLKDYKGVFQVSDRVFNKNLGIVAQGSAERFNRGGDIVSYSWRQGRTDPATGNTAIDGNTLAFEDGREIRERLNGSVNLDYTLKKHTFSLFGIYSQTDRNQFSLRNSYNPVTSSINYESSATDNSLKMNSVALSATHPVGKLLIDWSLSNAVTLGKTPYDFSMRFVDEANQFDPALNRMGHPRTFFDAANPDLNSSFLRSNDYVNSQTKENSKTAFVNFKLPVSIGKWLGGYLKAGGKYYSSDRDRNYDLLSEGFYYLGSAEARRAANQYKEPLIYSSLNGNLISIKNFLETNNNQENFYGENGEPINFDAKISPEIMRKWFDAQLPVLNKDRSGIVNNYKLKETVSAAYAMIKLEIGKKLTIIPGFRYEYSNNTYSAGFTNISGRYGVNGEYKDTTTYKKYGEFLPHLHIKLQPLSWLDIRGSIAATLARPDYNFITPRALIDDNDTNINAGNPNLQHAKAMNYDLNVSAYKGGLGLITFGVFYKDVKNIFVPWNIQLTDKAMAAANGWAGYSGYELNSYTNLPKSSVWGYEADIQTNLSFLPKPFNGVVFNLNYSRLYSETEVFFLTSETVLIRPFPPIFQTTYTSQVRKVNMPSQAPHIFNMSVGYDLKSFSARVSAVFQGTKPSSYSLNKDFDRFNLQFWRWDASIRQGIGSNWSLFLNLNNFSNQQDISFTRNIEYLNSIQTYGFTGTVGFQYRL